MFDKEIKPDTRLKTELSQSISEDIDRFLAAGGKIQVITRYDIKKQIKDFKPAFNRKEAWHEYPYFEHKHTAKTWYSIGTES